MGDLVQEFERYDRWRGEAARALGRYRDWLARAELSDAAGEQRIERLLARLADDRLTVAFVAEFSRGKSELINAIFFADYGQRILPSAAGRTTMCPTELLYDETFPPSIRLLPIETRAEPDSTSDFKAKSQVWTVLPLDVDGGDGMLEAFKQVSLTKRVPVEEARRYGLVDDADPDAARLIDTDGTIEISRWRHAIVNFPHPLLKRGLVIIDTPGLNAIGTEPELTLNLIPNAQAVLYILAADTGVTKSDIEVWREHIGGGPGRMAVLNKIDGMWDDLRGEAEVESQIAAQVDDVARTLALTPSQVFPVSAQKGLLAKVRDDAALLAKSRLPELERALSGALIDARRELARSRFDADVRDLAANHRALLSTRSRNVTEQLIELKSLRGKNRGIIDHMMKRIAVERREFDGSLVKLQGTRAVFARLSAEVFTSLGMEVLKGDVARAREEMRRSRFSVGFREAVRDFFARLQANLALSAGKTDEIAEMMSVMYRKFSNEHGLALATPMPFSLDKYRQEIALIESVTQKQFGPAALMTTRQVVLMEKFFESVASRVKQCFLHANRDVEAWLKVVMAPLEAQIREHKKQLRQRTQSIERIGLATETLEEKVTALEAMQADLARQAQQLAALESALLDAALPAEASSTVPVSALVPAPAVSSAAPTPPAPLVA
ncbi:MAG: dynamin family protein [Burkholderiaceae bacterium]